MNNEDQLFDEAVRRKVRQRTFTPSSTGWENAEKLIEQNQAMRAGWSGSTIRLSTALLLILGAAFIGAGLVYFSMRENVTTAGINSPVHLAEKQNPEQQAALFTPNISGTEEIAGSNSSEEKGVVDSQKSLVSKQPVKIPSENKNEGDAVVPEKIEAIIPQQVTEPRPQAFYSEPVEISDGGIVVTPEDGAGINDANGEPAISIVDAGENNPLDSLIPGAELNTDSSNGSFTEFIAEASMEDSLKQDSLPFIAQSPATELPDQHDSVTVGGEHHSGPDYWLVQGGVSFAGRFTPETKSGQSVNPVIGVGYNKWLNPRMSVQVGLRYTSIGNASDSSSTVLTGSSGSIIAGPGTTNYYTETRLRRLHYLSLPIQLSWRIGGRHSLNAGYALNYLGAAEVRERSFTEVNGSISDQHHKTAFGYTQGLNRFDGTFMLGYSIALTRHFGAEVNCFAGLTDIKNNRVYGVNRFERNRGCMLLLHYSF